VKFEWFMALRFLREGRFQSLLILGGVAVGVGVIVFISALMSGLQASLIRQTLGSQPHITIKPQEEAPRPLMELAGPAEAASLRIEKAPQRPHVVAQWQQVMEAAERLEGVVAAAPIVSGSAFAVRGSVNKTVNLRGVIPERYDRIVHISERLKLGTFNVAGPSAVLGVELAKVLGLSVGEKVRLSANGGASDTFTVTGLFDIGNRDLNERWVFVSLNSAQNMLELPGGVTSVELRVDRIFEADRIAARVAAVTGLIADPWTKLNRELLIALKSQDSSSYIIQFFVIVAVALGIASVLVVSVVQKSREIGILKAVGTSTKIVRRIFLIQGAVVGVAGSVLGCGLGAGLATIFANLATAPDGTPIFPVDLNLGLYLTASAIATVTGLVAAVAPAQRAARLDPAEVIRYG
jgi:lipoprotein-releasing system permease protein